MSLQFATKVAKSFDCLKYLSEIEVNSIFKLQTVYMTFIVHHFLLTGRGSKEAKEEESQAEVGVSFVRHLVHTSLNVTIPLGWKPNKSGRQRATCNPPPCCGSRANLFQLSTSICLVPFNVKIKILVRDTWFDGLKRLYKITHFNFPNL